jgi:diguanylate cyclase (GGDEF)-like protein
MRKGRFSRLEPEGGADVAPLSSRALLLFDFRAPSSETDSRVAQERCRSVEVSVPFLAGSHLLWGGLFLGAMAGQPGTALVAAPVAAILLLDFLLWRLLRGDGRQAHAKARIAAWHTLATTVLWLGAVVLAGLVGVEPSMLAKTAFVAAVSAGIAAFFAVPGLLILSCAAMVGATALVAAERTFLGVAVGAGAVLTFLSISRARDLILGAHQRLAGEWQARQARRFVEEYEESGRGWFWETNADGAVTYLSAQLAVQLGIDGGRSIGRRLADLLLLKQEEGAEEARSSLDFHLGARFPFSDVIVRAAGEGEAWWSISGTPNFDEFGRFLGFRGIGANLSEQRRTEVERTKLARYDSLTGLPNRATMRSTLDDALRNAAERRKGCTLMMIDLDRFKQVNDTLGHPVGDQLLKQVAERLKAIFGQDGQVGRLGGDEFEAILPGIDEEGRLSEIAQCMIEEVSKPYSLGGHRVEIGASAGIAIARPGKAYASALIKDADLALYAAKAAGRGTFRFFAPEMHAEAAERQILENDLRDALAKDQLRLLYQPIVDSVTEEVVAFEALLRWQHPTRSLLQPAHFLPIAEDCGLMPRIGAWVIRSACAEAAKWPEHVRIAVNLSPAQVGDPGLPSVVTSALAASALAPDRLELEITEGAFPADGAGPERMFARLKMIGVRIALDNFGTGRSGLGHLREAPLDKIKIDRSFVRGAETPGSRNAAIIRAIVVLGESLGMDTTAEGAETLEELALIRSLGCSQVQGFLFGKPMPAAEALALARASKPTAEVVGFSRPPRHRLIRNGVVHAGGEAVAVRLRNISAGGAMVECDRPLPVETQVVLDLDEAGALEAEVRWCNRGQIGLRFAEEFQLRKLSRPKPGAGGLKMLAPDYLSRAPAPAEAAESPVLRKRARR